MNNLIKKRIQESKSDLAKRRRFIKWAKANRYSFAQIGEWFGISRQRAWKIGQ